MSTGNTFNKGTYKFGAARKVWRSVRHVYPGGGVIKNVSDFVTDGIIKAGTPVNFDNANHEITVYKDSELTSANAATLNVSGYLQEDIVIKDANTVATGTVVYAGELYSYVFDSAIATVLKGLTTTPQITFVE